MTITEPVYALFITGNPGTGKSFIANSLGANFESGFSTTGGGVTTELQKEIIMIRDQPVLIVDAPGLIESNIETTQKNASEITKALSISKNTPCKLGVVVTDNNGRIQSADVLLIKKLHEALTPKFELLLIVNQIRKKNIKFYSTEVNANGKSSLQNLIEILRENTKADIQEDRAILIAEYEQDEKPDMNPLINILDDMRAIHARKVERINVTRQEFEALGRAIVFYSTVATGVVLAPVWGLPYLVYKAVKHYRRS